MPTSIRIFLLRQRFSWQQEGSESGHCTSIARECCLQATKMGAYNAGGGKNILLETLAKYFTSSSHITDAVESFDDILRDHTSIAVLNCVMETFTFLLERGDLKPLQIRDYLQSMPCKRLEYREKSVLALVLPRCLRGLLDEESDLPSTSEKVQSSLFENRSILDANNLETFDLLRQQYDNRIGSPLFVFFAKLLFEIYAGEKIPLDVHDSAVKNLTPLAQLSAVLMEWQKNGIGGSHARAIKGCLYSHLQCTSSTTALEGVIRDLELQAKPERRRIRRKIY